MGYVLRMTRLMGYFYGKKDDERNYGANFVDKILEKECCM